MERLRIFLPQLSITALYCKEGFVGLCFLLPGQSQVELRPPPVRPWACPLGTQRRPDTEQRLSARPPAYHSPQGVNQQWPAWFYRVPQRWQIYERATSLWTWLSLTSKQHCFKAKMRVVFSFPWKDKKLLGIFLNAGLYNLTSCLNFFSEKLISDLPMYLEVCCFATANYCSSNHLGSQSGYFGWFQFDIRNLLHH